MTEARIYLQSTDDRIRATKGVVACLRDVGDGRLRLIFDDVRAEAGSSPPDWRYETFFTWNEYDSGALDSMTLSDEQYQYIGVALVARLLAINNRLK